MVNYASRIVLTLGLDATEFQKKPPKWVIRTK